MIKFERNRGLAPVPDAIMVNEPAVGTAPPHDSAAALSSSCGAISCGASQDFNQPYLYPRSSVRKLQTAPPQNH